MLLHQLQQWLDGHVLSGRGHVPAMPEKCRSLSLERPVAFAALLCLSLPLYAQDPAPVQSSLSGSYEQVSLPGNETMGFASIGLSQHFTQNMSLGVASYAAVKGERGGFITLGFTGEGNWPLDNGWSLEAGGFVGAGGGRGGYMLSGGGLMLRANAGIGLELVAAGLPGRLSAGVSHIRFPDGNIASTQPYLSYALPFDSLIGPGWNYGSAEYSPALAKQLGLRTHEVGVVTRWMAVSDGTRNDTGGAQADFDLLGIEWRTWLGRYAYARLESEGAMGGGATGYMQILGGVGLRVPLTSRLTALASASLGGGGGGGVDTGGGFLVDAGVGLQGDITRRWFAEAAIQHLRAPSASLEANSAALKLGYRFGPKDSDNSVAVLEPHALRIRAANQTYIQAADNWRSHHTNQSVQNLGVQVDAFISPEFYLTGQGLAAWHGDAGAYMTGQVGAGRRIPFSQQFSAELELLFGAAGGGGLEMGSGLVTQGNAGVVWQATDSLSLHASAGYLYALDGMFRAKVAGLAVGYRFTGYSLR